MDAALAIDPVPREAAARRPRFPPDVGFRKELDQRVEAYFARTGRSSHGGWRMALKTATVLGWFVASYVFLVVVADTWWQGVLGAVSLIFAIGGVGFSIQHDANHEAYSRHRVINRVLERSLDLLGASSYIWRWKHNVFHHTYTNVRGGDHDIELAPWARLTPSQRRRPVHRFQHIYMWALYGFTVYNMQMVEDFMNLKTGKVGPHRFPRPRGARLVELFVARLVFFGWTVVVPLLLGHAWWVVLAFYGAIWFSVGVLLAVVFQIAHCHEDAIFPTTDEAGRLDDAWAIHQVKTTADFAPGNWFVTWYVGGLNYQIEHHLFPKICHVHHPALAGIVREVCREHGVPHQTFPSFLGAVVSHGRLLRRMGRAAA